MTVTEKHLSDASFILGFPDLLEDYQWLADNIKRRGIGSSLSADELRELSIAKRIIDAQSRSALGQGCYQQLPEDHPAVPFLMRAFAALLTHDFARAQAQLTRAVIEASDRTDQTEPDDPNVKIWEIEADDLERRQTARRFEAQRKKRAS